MNGDLNTVIKSAVNKLSLKGKFDEYHKHIKNTRDERMLQTHEAYKKVWNTQMRHSIQARESLHG